MLRKDTKCERFFLFLKKGYREGIIRSWRTTTSQVFVYVQVCNVRLDTWSIGKSSKYIIKKDRNISSELVFLRKTSNFHFIVREV